MFPSLRPTLSATTLENHVEEFPTSEKHSLRKSVLRKSRLPSPKRHKTEKEIAPPPVAESWLDPGQTDNPFSRAYKKGNLKIMKEVPRLIEKKKSLAPKIIALKHFIQEAVVEDNARKLDFLAKGFEEYSKEWKIVHPSTLFLQKGVDHSSSKRVTLMQQCLAEVSNKEVCTHLLNWVSIRNLINYLLEPTVEGPDMLIVEVAAQDRNIILELMFDRIGDFNLPEKEETSLREQATKRNLSQATIAILNKHLNWYIIPSNMKRSKKIAILLADQKDSQRERQEERQVVAQIIRQKGYQLKEILKFSKSEFKDYLQEVKNLCSIILMVVMSHRSDGTLSATEDGEMPIDEITNMICLEVPNWIPKVLITQISPTGQPTDFVKAHSTSTEHQPSYQEVLRRSKSNSIQLLITTKDPLSLGDSMLHSLMEEWRDCGESKEFEDMVTEVGKAKSEQYSLQKHDKLINRLLL